MINYALKVVRVVSFVFTYFTTKKQLKFSIKIKIIPWL